MLSNKIRKFARDYRTLLLSGPVEQLEDLAIEAIQLEADNAALKERIDALEAVGIEAMDKYVDAAEKNDALQKQVEGLRKFVAMFDTHRLEGMFNHYMEMQKQAIHGQSGESTVKFWYERTKSQREIIEAFEALQGGE